MCEEILNHFCATISKHVTVRALAHCLETEGSLLRQYGKMRLGTAHSIWTEEREIGQVQVLSNLVGLCHVVVRVL